MAASGWLAHGRGAGFLYMVVGCLVSLIELLQSASPPTGVEVMGADPGRHFKPIEYTSPANTWDPVAMSPTMQQNLHVRPSLR